MDGMREFRRQYLVFRIIENIVEHGENGSMRSERGGDDQPRIFWKKRRKLFGEREFDSRYGKSREVIRTAQAALGFDGLDIRFREVFDEILLFDEKHNVRVGIGG